MEHKYLVVGEYELDNEVQVLMFQAQVQTPMFQAQVQAPMLQAQVQVQIHLVWLEDLYPE